MWKRKDDCRWGNFLQVLKQKISMDKYFCFRFGTKVFIFLFIDKERCDR